MLVTIKKITPVHNELFSDDGKWSNEINCIEVEYTAESKNAELNGILKLTGDVDYLCFSVAELREKVIQQIRSF